MMHSIKFIIYLQVQYKEPNDNQVTRSGDKVVYSSGTQTPNWVPLGGLSEVHQEYLLYSYRGKYNFDILNWFF